MNAAFAQRFLCSLTALVAVGCYVGPTHVHEVDKAYEDRLQGLEQRVSTLEQGSENPGNTSAPVPRSTGMGSRVQPTGYIDSTRAAAKKPVLNRTVRTPKPTIAPAEFPLTDDAESN